MNIINFLLEVEAGYTATERELANQEAEHFILWWTNRQKPVDNSTSLEVKNATIREALRA
jgi:hypothetical protein